ncbi:MAG: hypothetical protein JKX69_06785 [Rhodobacteraceae bacterium]|nr:hypothetical protein [Paracoccaceae bacterium]
MARLLHGAGHRVILADSLRQSVSFSTRAAKVCTVLPGPNQGLGAYGAALGQLINKHKITDIVPTCEEVFHLAQLAGQGQLAAKLHAPSIATLAQVHNKFTFQEIVREMGHAGPKTTLLASAQDLVQVRANAAKLVFKPVWSRFGSEVLIRPRPDEVNIAPSPNTPWLAQEALSGDEICAYALATQGRLTALSLYKPLYRAGLGAGVFFEPLRDMPDLRAFVSAFVAATNWSGQISFDLMLLPDGQIMPLECNPRATSGLHFFADGPAFAAALFAGKTAMPDVSRPQTIPLALWLYAGPTALTNGQLKQLWRDAKRADNLLRWPGDTAPARRQLPALAEIIWLALRRKQSLQAAATADIEWNGP